MKCIHCGASLRPTAKLCIQCGNAVTAEVSQPAPAASSMAMPEPVAPTLPQPPLPSEPMVASQPAASAAPMAPAVEVAPEFAAPVPAAARHEQASAVVTKGGQSGQKMALVGLAVLVVAAAAAYVLSSGSGKTTTQTASESAPAPAPAPATQSVAPAAAPAQRPLDRAVLNEMLQLVAESKWTEFVALTQVLVPVGAGQTPEALREQAQASLAKQQPEQAQQAVLEALLRDPQSGASWLMAARVFAERDASGPAESALRLAYYFARDRQQAMASLTDMAKSAEPKFKAVVNSQLPELSKIPAR